eukprot:Amastigsp_a843985_7.p1 type:complete len:321 gc:universal Amastigsp_a843985_7:130-1092(+)
MWSRSTLVLTLAALATLACGFTSGRPCDSTHPWVTRLLAHAGPTGPPPRPDTLSAELRAAFTMGGRVPFEQLYIDDSDKGRGTEFEFDADTMHAFVEQAAKELSAQIRPRRPVAGIRVAFRDAVAANKALFVGAHVVVFGTTEPWAEALALAAGAAHVTTVEYNRVLIADGRVTVTSPRALALQVANGSAPQFDVAVSLSSFDHDGLGRYGDPLGADADLDSCDAVRCVLGPRGVFFLALPQGADVVVFNMHRRYGPVRLPRMLESWRVLAQFGVDERLREAAVAWRQSSYEPVLVLVDADRARVAETAAASSPTKLSEL